MERKPVHQPEERQVHHEGGDPASLEQDPAQFYPTGGAGLIDPKNDPLRDTGGGVHTDEPKPPRER